MKKATKVILRVIISTIYIIWGILSPLAAINTIIDLDLGAIISAVVGVLTLLAGIFGLLGISKAKCRVFGIVIFVASMISVVSAVLSAGVSMGIVSPIINALLAWLFIAVIK